MRGAQTNLLVSIPENGRGSGPLPEDRAAPCGAAPPSAGASPPRRRDTLVKEPCSHGEAPPAVSSPLGINNGSWPASPARRPLRRGAEGNRAHPPASTTFFGFFFEPTRTKPTSHSPPAICDRKKFSVGVPDGGSRGAAERACGREEADGTEVHALWTIDRDYMAPPTHGKRDQMVPALLVTPPAGFEVGHVPIVIRQEAAPRYAAGFGPESVTSPGCGSQEKEELFDEWNHNYWLEIALHGWCAWGRGKS